MTLLIESEVCAFYDLLTSWSVCENVGLNIDIWMRNGSVWRHMGERPRRAAKEDGLLVRSILVRSLARCRLSCLGGVGRATRAYAVGNANSYM